MMLMPGPIPLRHIATPAKVVEVLRVLCNLDVSDTLLKVTLQLSLPYPPCCTAACKVAAGCTDCIVYGSVGCRQQSCGWQAMQRQGGVTCSEQWNSTRR